jgi:FMN phosphatase YigB (HAD superfamily)
MPPLVRLRPDADEFLARTHLPAIIVTNGFSQMQRTKVVAAGLQTRVHGVIVSQEVGSEKPDAGIFRAALALAGCQPEEAVMIGDHPVNDIAGAQAAGIEAVFVRSRWFEPPTIEMGTLGGFPNPPATLRSRRSRLAPHAIIEMGTLGGSPNPPATLRSRQSRLAPHAIDLLTELPW